MKRRDFLRAAAITGLMAPLVSPASAQLPGGIDELVRELGFALEIPLNKAVGGSGALLNIAREKLSESEFSEISEFVSGVERLIQQAGNIVSGGLPKSIDEMSIVMEKLALPVGATTQFQSFMSDYVGRRGGKKITKLLQKAWKG